jgi:hypothetical protein
LVIPFPSGGRFLLTNLVNTLQNFKSFLFLEFEHFKHFKLKYTQTPTPEQGKG